MRAEERAATGSKTKDEIARMDSEARSGINADDLAMAEACAGLWERALASATTEPMTLPMQGINSMVLALAGRGLSARGEAVFLIMVDGDEVSLAPAGTWDINGDADPATWRYRVDLTGPSGTTSGTYPHDAVVHFRINADPRTPWRGKSPLKRAEATAKLAEAIEKSLTSEALLPVGRIAPYGGTPKQIAAYASNLVKGGITAWSASQTIPHGQEPASRFSPQAYGPAPDQVMDALRTKTGFDICAAFGIPPALFESRGDGSGQREAWRRFWAGTISPIGKILEAEIKIKLDPDAVVSFEALRASDEDGRSRAVARRATAYKTYRDAGVEDGEARRLSGLE